MSCAIPRLLILLLLPAGWMGAQSLRFDRVSAEQRLSSVSVHCLLQDSRGFIWIGTDEGLLRFDGHHLKEYQHLPDDPHSLLNNYVTVIYEDRAKTLWVGSNGGLSRYDPLRENFLSYARNADDSLAIGTTPVNSLYEDLAGRFWIMTWNGGLQELDRAKGTFKSYYPDTSGEYRVQEVFYSPIVGAKTRPENSFFIAARSFQKQQWSLFEFDTDNKTYHPYPAVGLNRVTYIFSVREDQKGTTWFSTNKGIVPFDGKTKTFLKPTDYPAIPQELHNQMISTVLEDQSGVLWVGTYRDGLYAIDHKRQKAEHYTHDPANPLSLSGNAITALLQDRSGVIWVGTSGKGLNRLVRENRKFQHVTLSPTNPSSRIDNAIAAVCEDHAGKIWIGTDAQGWGWLDRGTGDLEYPWKNHPEVRDMGFRQVISTCETRDGDVWLGTNYYGLIQYDRDRDKFVTYVNDPADSTSLANNYIKTIYEDRSGDLWLGTYLGLDKLERSTGKFKHYRNKLGKTVNDANDYVNTMLQDRSGTCFWFATEIGLSLLNPADGTFRHFLQPRDRPTGYNTLAVQTLCQDHSGAIWAGTNVGLYKLVFPEPAQPFAGEPVITHYSEAQGLPDNSIMGILEDVQGSIWLSTYRGISEFKNPQHDSETMPDFKNYDTGNGVQGAHFREGACFKNQAGEMFFGGDNGLNVFHPDSIRYNPHPPPVVITAFEKFDADNPESTAVSEKGIADRNEVVLSYKNNIFTIEFAALDFREPEKNRYAYRMEGFNDNWIQLGNQRRVTFTNLDPGTYTFQVRGSNNDGVWNETGATLKITITPPWWRASWAYAVYLLLAVAAIAGFVKARVRYFKNRTLELEQAVNRSTAQILEQKEQLEHQAGELQELDRLKSRFYANITHELRTPLTLMLGPLHSVLKNGRLALEELDLLKIAQQNGQKLLYLVSDILDLGKLEANKITLEESPVLLEALLMRLVGQFDSHAAHHDINLYCRCELPPRLTVLIDVKKFETILNNLLSNALKFTPKGGTVTVGLLDQEQTLLLEVRDTGRGIHPDDLPHVFDRYFQTKRPDAPVEGGTGIGLALCAELVRLSGGRIWVESAFGTGSSFFVDLPKKEALPTATSNEIFQEKIETRGEQKSDAAATAPVQENPGNPEILVVEDNPDLQEYLRHVLSPEYDIAVAGNGEEALVLLETARAELIISDIMMPRMDGFQLLERLKSDDRYRHIPVVMLTARADIQDKLRALRTGVDDYLTKPFNEEELLARVRNLLQRQHSRSDETPEQESSAVSTPHISQADAEWLAELEAWVQANLHKEFLTVGELSHQAALSERQLLRRLRELTGLSPQQYIAEFRMQKARDLLERGAFRTVAEAAYKAGFGHAKAFSRAYRERFGRLPSSYF